MESDEFERVFVQLLTSKSAAEKLSDDFFATIHASLGIDYTKNLYDQDRPVPITDMGKPIERLFA